MVLLASSFDQSKYFCAEDLTQEKLLRIKSVSVELVGPKQEQKPVVWFTNHTKGLPLNKTNNRTIRAKRVVRRLRGPPRTIALSCRPNGRS